MAAGIAASPASWRWAAKAPRSAGRSARSWSGEVGSVLSAMGGAFGEGLAGVRHVALGEDAVGGACYGKRIDHHTDTMGQAACVYRRLLPALQHEKPPGHIVAPRAREGGGPLCARPQQLIKHPRQKRGRRCMAVAENNQLVLNTLRP